jgi:hypothetical protein
MRKALVLAVAASALSAASASAQPGYDVRPGVDFGFAAPYGYTAPGYVASPRVYRGRLYNHAPGYWGRTGRRAYRWGGWR